MKFDFGYNLRCLRQQKGFTQDKVAEFFHTTPQSVSRWENNVSLPDIFLLPDIASFYDVTTDYLLGVDFQHTVQLKEQKSKKREDAHKKREIATAYQISSRLYDRYPNDKIILDCAMRDSYLMGFYCNDEHRLHYFNESIALAERFYDLSDDMNEQSSCIKNIAVCYKLMGDHFGAEEWVNKLPSAWHCKENTAFSVLENYGNDCLQKDLTASIHLLYRLMHKQAADAKTSAEKKAVYEKIIALLKIYSAEESFTFCNDFLKKTEEMKEALQAK